MRKMLTAMLLGVALLFTGGCAELLVEFDTAAAMNLMGEIRTKGEEVSDKVLDSAADAADKYCITPATIRLWLRDEINTRTEVATVSIVCPGDPEPPVEVIVEEVLSG